MLINTESKFETGKSSNKSQLANNDGINLDLLWDKV